jgi:hypothetical protein
MTRQRVRRRSKPLHRMTLLALVLIGSRCELAGVRVLVTIQTRPERNFVASVFTCW